jgi:hypothetical protein
MDAARETPICLRSVYTCEVFADKVFLSFPSANFFPVKIASPANYGAHGIDLQIGKATAR